MKPYRISRAPGAASDSFDPYAKLVFEPSIESDELFDVLRESYPTLKTHTERKKQAVLDFLMEERRAIEQEITAFVQHTGTPAATPVSASTPYYTPSGAENRKSSTSGSSSSAASSQSAGSSPEIMTLKDMTNVWTANGQKPKIHTRRSMTSKEKEEYRRRRQMKACKECRGRKRKCNHDTAQVTEPSTSRVNSKVKKRSSGAPSPTHSQNTSLAVDRSQIQLGQYDNANGTESNVAALNSPLDFLDFSPTITDGSFDDFLLLPNDDFSMGMSTDPLFNTAPAFDTFTDPFIGMPASNLYTASDSRSQSSGMAHTPSTAVVSPAQSAQSGFNTADNWNFDFIDPRFDGLVAAADDLTASPRTERERWHAVSDGTTETHTLNAHTSALTARNLRASPFNPRGPPFDLPVQSAANVSPAGSSVSLVDTRPFIPRRQAVEHTLEAFLNRANDVRLDGAVLGTDPSATSRFGEHGQSLLRNSPNGSGAHGRRGEAAGGLQNSGGRVGAVTSVADGRLHSFNGAGNTGLDPSAARHPVYQANISTVLLGSGGLDAHSASTNAGRNDSSTVVRQDTNRRRDIVALAVPEGSAARDVSTPAQQSRNSDGGVIAPLPDYQRRLPRNRVRGSSSSSGSVIIDSRTDEHAYPASRLKNSGRSDQAASIPAGNGTNNNNSPNSVLLVSASSGRSTAPSASPAAQSVALPTQTVQPAQAARLAAPSPAAPSSASSTTPTTPNTPARLRHIWTSDTRPSAAPSALLSSSITPTSITATTTSSGGSATAGTYAMPTADADADASAVVSAVLSATVAGAATTLLERFVEAVAYLFLGSEMPSAGMGSEERPKSSERLGSRSRLVLESELQRHGLGGVDGRRVVMV